jgi:DNA-binding MarR family transcriptional regulator
MHNAQLIQHLQALMARDMDQILLEQLGIGLAQYRIMYALSEHPHIQQKVIAATLGQTEASVSRQIKLLQEKGMLRADQNPSNRREHLADLTPKGLQVIEAANQILVGYEQKFFAGLTEKQQAQLSEILQALHRDVCYLSHPGVETIG